MPFYIRRTHPIFIEGFTIISNHDNKEVIKEYILCEKAEGNFIIKDQILNTPVDVYREPIRRNTPEEVTQHPIGRSSVKTSKKRDKSLEE